MDPKHLYDDCKRQRLTHGVEKFWKATALKTEEGWEEVEECLQPPEARRNKV